MPLGKVKAKSRPNHLPTLHSGCSRVHVKESRVRIPLDLEDMTVAADEKVGPGSPQKLLGPWVVMARAATDMGYQHSHAFLCKKLVFREFLSYVEPVAIAVNSHYGLSEVAYLLHKAKPTAPVSGVPDDIYRRQEIGKLFGKDAVGVGQKAYEHIRRLKTEFVEMALPGPGGLECFGC